MRRFVSVLAAILAVALLAGCGGGNGEDGENPSPNSSSGDDAVRAYVADLCGPFETFFNDAGDLLLSFENVELDAEADVDEAFAGLDGVIDPMQQLIDDAREIEPPDEMRDYHDAAIEQLEYAADAIEAVSEGGFFAAFLLPTPPATPDEPEGFDAAIEEECGEELAEFIDDFDTGGISEDSSEPGITVEPLDEPVAVRGSIGETISNGEVELTVHGVEDPYPPADEFFGPEEGNRWVVVDVSITNTSSETLDYNTFDFRVKDAGDFEYDAGVVDVDRELGFGSVIAGDTVRGNVGFEVPEESRIVRLIYEPGFFGEGRIDIDLQ